MSNWKAQAYREIQEELTFYKDSKDAMEIKVSTHTLKIAKLEKQLTCEHEMEVSTNGGCFGGSDIDKCKLCDYEWVY